MWALHGCGDLDVFAAAAPCRCATISERLSSASPYDGDPLRGPVGVRCDYSPVWRYGLCIHIFLRTENLRSCSGHSTVQLPTQSFSAQQNMTLTFHPSSAAPRARKTMQYSSSINDKTSRLLPSSTDHASQPQALHNSTSATGLTTGEDIITHPDTTPHQNPDPPPPTLQTPHTSPSHHQQTPRNAAPPPPKNADKQQGTRTRSPVEATLEFALCMGIIAVFMIAMQWAERPRCKCKA